jgi:hypothetical protein
MRYYDHYHEPNTHLQLTRQSEDELLGAGKRRELRPGLEATDEVIRELRAVRQRLEALEAKVQRLHS